MKIERSITASTRGTAQTLGELSTFVADLLTARSYPGASEVQAQLTSLAPLFNLLLVKRAMAAPALVISTPDMRVAVHLDYDVNANEDLSVPDTTLLGDLAKDAQVEVLLRVTEEIAPELTGRVSQASDHPARLTLTVVDMVESSPDPSPSVDPLPISDPLPETEPTRPLAEATDPWAHEDETKVLPPPDEPLIPQQKSTDEELGRPVA